MIPKCSEKVQDTANKALPPASSSGPIMRGLSGAIREVGVQLRPGQPKLGDLAGIAEAQEAYAEGHRKRSIKDVLNGDSE